MAEDTEHPVTEGNAIRNARQLLESAENTVKNRKKDLAWEETFLANRRKLYDILEAQGKLEENIDFDDFQDFILAQGHNKHFASQARNALLYGGRLPNSNYHDLCVYGHYLYGAPMIGQKTLTLIYAYVKYLANQMEP